MYYFHSPPMYHKLSRAPFMNDSIHREEHPYLYRPRIHHMPPNNVGRASFSKEEAAAIALLLGIDFTKSPFDLNEFWRGVNTELEHGRRSSRTDVTGDDPLMTGKIAWAHLNEFPDYYQRLTRLEEQAKAYWNKR